MKPKVEEKTPPRGEKERSQGDSDQEMLNLDNEIYSLTHYADDEEELVAQMFATIKGSKLDAMMPPILKEIPLIDVQQLCLHELRGMSQRRILSIINGQEMSGSSSDEDSGVDKKHVKLQYENEESNFGGKMEDGDKDALGDESNLTALDLLELEMRAKLIKTMLEKQDGDEEESVGNGFVPDIKIKEEPLTPESTRLEDDENRSLSTRRTSRRYSRRRRSGSRSYSSSYSRSSRSDSYSSRSRSRSSSRSRRRRSGSGSKSGSGTSMSSGRGVDGSQTPESKKPTKKKITKKEFEARMKKAKLNRSYRKRKDSEDDSGGDKRAKWKAKKQSKKAPVKSKAVPPPEEGEEGCPEEGAEPVAAAAEEEAPEKEEGEIDSNEEGALSSSDSRSRSRSYSSGSYSSYSSRSRSYSRSPSRRRSSRRRRRKSRKYRRGSRSSRSPADGPKVPNWQQQQQSVKSASPKETPAAGGDAEEKPDAEESLPIKEDRQSISFSFSKKSAPIKSNPDLNDDGLPSGSVGASERTSSPREASASPSPSEEESPAEGKTAIEVASSEGQPSFTSVVVKEESKANDQREPQAQPAEVAEDFYKGADQLSFSEEEAGEIEEEAGEVEEEADMEQFLHDDTPVEPIQVADATLRKSVKLVSSKDEPPVMSWENKKDRMDGVGFLSEPLSDVALTAEDSNEATKERATPEDASHFESLMDTLEESSQEVPEPLHDLDAEDSQGPRSMDIIGVIDPKEPVAEEQMLEQGGSSWSMRWLQSEKVQKVVSNSKMLSKVRKNIQAKGKASVKERPKQAPPPVVEVKPVVEVVPKKVEVKPPKSRSGSNVIGSIEEYEKLFGIRVKAPTSLPQPKSTPKVSAAASMLDSDDDEDSEEEALWSKIMQK